MFKELSIVPNLPELEENTLKYWDSLNIVEKLKSLRKDAKEKVYYDGPITANNMPHYGHVITWTLKDIIPRYWSMQGYYVSRNMGWDCQGLPVEIEVEKTLGFKEKEDIEKFGVEKFNQLCKESVFKYRDEIFKYEKRIGRWFDDSDVYYTMDKNFIESMWWSFKELFTKGLIYEGHKVVPYSTRAGSPLSHHEVAEGGYKEVEDAYITVKFKIKSLPNTYILAWTTTPWTIPGNLLLAVGKKIDYVKVKYENDFYILAKSRVEAVFHDKTYEITEPVTVEDLLKMEYEPPFNYYENKRKEGCFKVVTADHANDEDGTGIVHLAPYGEEDFDVFMKLSIPMFDYLNDTAHFTNEIPEYAGMFYADANKAIINDLSAKNLLFDTGLYVHRMPMCYRTKTPLIYKPIKSWYLAVTKIKDRMVEENETVNWVPAHLKKGMSYQWISNARDWAISRNRYWGTPMPIWINDKTKEMFVAGSFAEIEEKSGVKIDDPHKPYVDSITWEDKTNGGPFKRIPDVLDAWYDSGSMPFAKLHYPFENKDAVEKGVKLPAEYIAEGLDQVRLWFYTMHILSVAHFDKVPYKNAVTNGMLTDKNGEKLSKSKRNFPPMDEVLNKYGADVLRLFVLTSPVVQAEGVRFYSEVLDDVKKDFFVLLWNSLRYFLTCANVANFVPEKAEVQSEAILDKWILLRLQETINTVTSNMDQYLIMPASKELLNFVQDLSTWYIRRSRDRLKNSDTSALKTLYFVLAEFSKLIAPMVPFMAESMYQLLNVSQISSLESVHLDLYPTAKALSEADKQLLAKMAATRDIASATLAVRSNEGIKVRQPLNDLSIHVKENITVREGPNLEFFEDLIADEVNVKNVSLTASEMTASENLKMIETDKFAVYVDTKITDELKVEGYARELIRKIQDMRKNGRLAVTDTINVTIESTEENKRAVKIFGEDIKKKVLAKDIIFGNNYFIVKI